MRYIGRFAPSPSGPLHLGSLIAAVASYLDAKANQGIWLVRMENLDPPREMTGADQLILEQLQAFDLQWDGSVLFQSERLQAYQQVLDNWLTNKTAYACRCPRKQIRASGGIYNGHCRHLNIPVKDSAVRYLNLYPQTEFKDRIHGKVIIESQRASEDFIIRRRDGLFAYQLAVVLDDIYQNVTHIVRGQDLIDTTVWQNALYNSLHKTPPQYAHIPLIMGEDGRKLSKQTGAPALDCSKSTSLLVEVLNRLGQNPPAELKLESNKTILDWGIKNWQLNKVPNH
ncbi:tRNA glutamyl-Q(34) synthetase GluQRS [Catenovulum sp. 2E275]|uniref:tRNA glutamyl-Q(34) synthetase GluQRS n=1 Tax=Catenovulum sp. 2E275 TaxID=2980497 RepID=UPI0021D0447E|nr:tRNA glutamyl-Q(34) synthetase GluQRS [Catenovulum sp. 2E275]MCU4675501.1 tRNA glutamyl-Q(34) synthetase GluQRS [Catenovulum sp. 2E275]